MIEDSMRFLRGADKARDYLSGALSERECMRLDRQLAFDPSFHGKIIELAERLRVQPTQEPVLAPTPMIVDDAWRRRTRGLQVLGSKRRSRSRRAFWPANDRGSRWTGTTNRRPSMLTFSIVAFACSFCLTAAAALLLAPQANQTLAVLLR